MNANEASPLVVHVCGLNGDPERVQPLLNTAARTFGWSPDKMVVYPFQVGLFSRTGLIVRAARLADWIQARWQENGRPDRVILMGHSIGGLLVRSAYLQARGLSNGQPQEWAKHVERIVLFASPNSGFYLNRVLWCLRPFAYLLAGMFRAYLTPEGSQNRRFAAVDSLAGSPFVTNLRLGWIRADQESTEALPLTVQLLGYADKLVEQEDSREIEWGRHNAHKGIDKAGHKDIIEIIDSDPDRTNAILNAIGGDVLPTEPIALPPKEQGIRSVVLLLHGIRAGVGGWNTVLADLLKEQMPHVMPDIASYGFYSALKFAVPLGHQKNFRNFAERYCYLIARHPDAEFHLVAHSNGTFVSGWVLRAVDQMSFTRVYLAGSVLPEQFDWSHSTEQIGTLVNACGRSDTPVGWLCRGLRGLGRRNIGNAGYSGFQAPRPGSLQLVDLTGGHGAGLTADRLPAVFSYIAGTDPLPTSPFVDPPWTTKAKNLFFNFISNTAKLIAWIAAAVVIAGGAYLVAHWPPAACVIPIVLLVIVVLLNGF